MLTKEASITRWKRSIVTPGGFQAAGMHTGVSVNDMILMIIVMCRQMLLRYIH
ncbi:hypothetical protein [Lentibacillus sp. CBA3610]|uniref:hypothetical protein n=1 Tax=Lentibacillus sp. CBA3610 TaxID=2518176 RepID=UPI0020D1FDE0|nr:hypothetical protein [Lentibacillus sp. CBA3610]